MQRAAAALQVLEAPLLGEPAALHHERVAEAFGQIVTLQRPEHAAPFARLENVNHDPVLRPAIQYARRLVEDQYRRPLQQRARDRDLLPVGGGKPRATDANLVAKADRHHLRPQPLLLENLVQHRADAADGLRLPGRHLAEKNIVLQHRGAVVARGIEELDSVAQVGGKMPGKVAARLQDAGLERFVYEAKAVAGRNQLERQRHQQVAVGCLNFFQAGIGNPGQHRLYLGQIVLLDETEALEEFVPRRQAAEQLDHGFGQLVAGLEHVVCKTGLIQHTAHVAVARQILEVELRLADGCAEKQIFGQRRVVVVAFDVELLDQALHAGRGKPRPDRLAREQHAVRQARMVRRIHRASQTEFEYRLLKLHRLQDLDDARVDVLGARGARGLVVDPVGIEIEQSTVGALCLFHLKLVLLELLAGVDPLAQRIVLEPVEQVVAHAGRKKVGRRTDVGDGASGHRLGRLGDVDSTDLQLAAARHHQASEHLRQLAHAGGVRAEDCHMLIDADFERNAVNQLRSRFPFEGQVGRAHRSGLRQLRLLDRSLALRRHHVVHRELLDHLGVLDLHVQALLIPVDQLLDRAGQVLVGGNHRHQRADVQAPHDHQITAHQVEQERRDLGQEIVEELDQELALIELEADAEDLPQARR